jgi:hypothetical protein
MKMKKKYQKPYMEIEEMEMELLYVTSPKPGDDQAPIEDDYGDPSETL